MPEGVDEPSVLNVINTMIGRNEIMVVPSGENDPLSTSHERQRPSDCWVIRMSTGTKEGLESTPCDGFRTQENTREEFISYRFQGRLLAEITVPDEAQKTLTSPWRM